MLFHHLNSVCMGTKTHENLNDLRGFPLSKPEKPKKPGFCEDYIETFPL